MRKIILFILFVFCSNIIIGCSSTALKTEFSNVGSFWWDDNLEVDKYLTFLSKNSVNHIYYCSTLFNQSTDYFITKAKSLNIKVYLLAGEYQWLENSSGLNIVISKYQQYQQTYTNSQFDGIHLDIEPHQHPLFDENRTQMILSLITLADYLNEAYPNINFDYDIPFWFNDEIMFSNNILPAYAHMINLANAVHIMSYRDSANEIYSIAKDEIIYAQQVNKPIYISIETKSNEGDKVSFMEEGKKEMYKQINELKEKNPKITGINIHHVKDWYNMA